MPRLHEQVDIHKANLEVLEEEVNNLLHYLASPKFQGVENNFVNAREMYDRINEIRMMLTSWKTYGEKIRED